MEQPFAIEICFRLSGEEKAAVGKAQLCADVRRVLNQLRLACGEEDKSTWTFVSSEWLPDLHSATTGPYRNDIPADLPALACSNEAEAL